MRLWQVHSSNSGNGAASHNSHSNGQRAVNQRLVTSLVFATHVVDDIAAMHDQQDRWDVLYGDYFTAPRDCMASRECMSGLMGSTKAWLQQHEEAQIMLASMLVVFGLWWMVRTILAVLINLVCPLLVVVLAVASCLLYVYSSIAIVTLLLRCYGKPTF